MAAFPLIFLQSVHSVLSDCALPHLPIKALPNLIASLLDIASPNNLVKLLQYAPSAESFIASHPTTPGGVVMLVSEILNILLTSTLLPATVPTQSSFAHDAVHGTVQSDHVGRLLETPLESSRQLYNTRDGVGALTEAQKAGARWLGDVMEPMTDARHDARRDSLFSVGAPDEESEITVAVLVSLRR
jgi:phosphatidylinositol 4-kinase